ncbi:MAG: acyl-CoA thioesterase [Rikenellaceae bacterium]
MISTDIQIRFSDVDTLRHVNNIVLQHYFDLGKGYYFKEILDEAPHKWRDNGFTTASTTTDYFEEVLPEYKIYVTTRVENIGTKSMVFLQEILNHDTQRVMSRSRSVMVAFDLVKRESIVISDALRSRIETHEAESTI